MALDRYFSEICAPDSDGVMRFYGWRPHCISLGCHQSDKLIDAEKLAQYGYDLVTRPTGGRAIFHANELTYSIIVPREVIHYRTLYGFLHEVIAKALHELNIHVHLESGQEKIPKIRHRATDYTCFTRSAYSEIQYRSMKVVGSAQKIYRNSILQHGSILIDREHLKILEFIKGTQTDISNLHREFSMKTISINEISEAEITPEDVTEQLLKQLELRGNISLYFKNVSKSELDSARLY